MIEYVFTDAFFCVQMNQPTVLKFYGKKGGNGMDKRLIAANALSFFSMVIVYQAFLTMASPLSAIQIPFSLMELNLWFMILSFLGVLLFAYTFRREPGRDVTRLLDGSLIANGLSVLMLAAGLSGQASLFFLLYCGGIAFPLACGYLDGCLFYLLARHTAPRRQGVSIGLYIAFTNGILFLVQRLVEHVTDAPLFLPWPLLLLALALIAFLLRPLPAEDTAQPVVPQTQVSNHLPHFCGIGILLSLLIGLSSTLDFMKYEEYYRNWHAISRLFLAAGYLAAGWLADHYPVWLPVAALLAKVAVFAAYTFVLEGAPLWFTIFADAFFSPFIILFIIWMFFNVALRSSRPELWAGMGRAIERPFHVLGALAGEMLLQHQVSHGVMSLVYMGLLIFAVTLLYRLFLLYAEAWKHSVVAKADPRIKAETAAGSENNNGTTIAPGADGVPIEDKKMIDMEPVVEEQVGSGCPDESGKGETMAEAEEAKPALSLPNDSDPLHGDRLRKYQLRYRLTNRETEVLWEILQKHKISEIAANLYITLPTAKYHISNILQKTGAKNQRELRYLIQKESL